MGTNLPLPKIHFCKHPELYTLGKSTCLPQITEGQNNKQGEASPSTAFSIKAQNKNQRPNACLALHRKNFMHEMERPLKIYQ